MGRLGGLQFSVGGIHAGTIATVFPQPTRGMEVRSAIRHRGRTRVSRSAVDCEPPIVERLVVLSLVALVCFGELVATELL